MAEGATGGGAKICPIFDDYGEDEEEDWRKKISLSFENRGR